MIRTLIVVQTLFLLLKVCVTLHKCCSSPAPLKYFLRLFIGQWAQCLCECVCNCVFGDFRPRVGLYTALRVGSSSYAGVNRGCIIEVLALIAFGVSLRCCIATGADAHEPPRGAMEAPVYHSPWDSIPYTTGVHRGRGLQRVPGDSAVWGRGGTRQ